MLILSILPLMALYVYGRLFWPLGTRFWLIIGSVMLLLTGCVPIYLHLHGGISEITLETETMLVADFMIITAVTWLILTGSRDACLLLSHFVCRPLYDILQRRTLALAIVLLGLVSSVWGMRNALLDPMVLEEEIISKRLPAALDGLTIVQISDLHVANVFGRKRTERIVTQVNALKPDLIAITGDLVDGTPALRSPALEPLSALKAHYGVYACEGNHDHYVDYDGWKRAYRRLGLDTLYNEHRVVRIQGEDLTIIGLTDPVAERFERELPNMRQALQGAPEGFRIVLEHQPKMAKRIACHRVDLILSGHTHGGQTPVFTLIVKYLNGGYVRGLYHVGSQAVPLYVHPGTGLWTGFCTRLLSRNAIVRITLRKKN